MKQIIEKLQCVDDCLDLADIAPESQVRELLAEVIDELKQAFCQTDVLSSRATTVYECRAVLLKQLFPVNHTNGYPCEAVPKATLLSLPQLMGVPDSLIA